MKRVPLSAKTQSLKDILAEDAAEENSQENKISISESGNHNSENENKLSEISNRNNDIRNNNSELKIPISDLGKPNSEIEPLVSNTEAHPLKAEQTNIGFPISEIRNEKSEISNQKVEKGDKSEYQKVTATLEPNLFWLLEDERRRRRRAKIEYTFSEIIREALTDYFVKQGKIVDINN